MTTKLVPTGTLRGHQAPVSSLQFIYIPSHVSYSATVPKESHESFSHSQDTDSTTPLLIPTLLTADELGWAIWWDLSTKRPLCVWRAHQDASVLTIKQLGVEWVLRDTVEVPILDLKSYGKVLTHGKDSSVRIWDLFQILDSQRLTYKLAGNFQRQLPLTEGEWPQPPYHEIPVNTLNFCNVDTCKELLITPGTTNSNNFDIYKLPTETTPLQRLFKGVDLYHMINPLDDNDRNFGIVMRLCFISSDKICVGYESGDVVLIQIVEFEIEVLATNSIHKPNPVLSMTYDPIRDQTLVTSASDKLLFINEHGYSVEAIKHHGICSIASKIDKEIGLVTWDGVTRIYDSNFNLKSKINKLTPSVKVNDLNVEAKDKLNVKIKLVLIQFSHIQQNTLLIKQQGTLHYNNGASKMIVRKRQDLVLDQNWLAVAFNNGRVYFYQF